MGKHLAIPPQSRRISPHVASEIGKTGGAISPPFLFPIGRRRDRAGDRAQPNRPPISPIRSDRPDVRASRVLPGTRPGCGAKRRGFPLAPEFPMRGGGTSNEALHDQS
jgi:hypothetical protein